MILYPILFPNKNIIQLNLFIGKQKDINKSNLLINLQLFGAIGVFFLKHLYGKIQNINYN
jgi:hypothetical protein